MTGKRFWTVAILLMTIAPLGCENSDSGKRTSGKKLRLATHQARRLYQKAHSLISNPRFVDGKMLVGELPDEARQTLDKAETLLTQAIKDWHEDLKKKEDISPCDVALSMLTLGQVRKLKSQIQFWSAGKNTASFQSVRVQTHAILDRLQRRSATINAWKRALSLSQDNLKAEMPAAEQAKTEAEGKYADIQKNIADAESQKSAALKNIETLSRKSSAARAEYRRDPSGKYSKLDEALQSEKQIDAEQSKVQSIEMQMIALEAKKEMRKSALDTTVETLKALQACKTQRTLDAEKLRSQHLQKEVALLSKDAKSALENLATLAVDVKKRGTAITASGGALDLLEEAKRDLTDALQQAESTLKPKILDEHASVFVASAEQYAFLRATRVEIEKLEKRTRSVWEKLAEGKPALNIPAGITEFIQNTAPEKTDTPAINAYSEALNLVNQSVREDPQTEEVWKHHFAQADIALSFAEFLAVIGQPDQAKSKLAEASAAIANALSRTFPARKKKTLLRLQKRIEGTSF